MLRVPSDKQPTAGSGWCETWLVTQNYLSCSLFQNKRVCSYSPSECIRRTPGVSADSALFTPLVWTPCPYPWACPLGGGPTPFQSMGGHTWKLVFQKYSTKQILHVSYFGQHRNLYRLHLYFYWPVIVLIYVKIRSTQAHSRSIYFFQTNAQLRNPPFWSSLEKKIMWKTPLEQRVSKMVTEHRCQLSSNNAGWLPIKFSFSVILPLESLSPSEGSRIFLCNSSFICLTFVRFSHANFSWIGVHINFPILSMEIRLSLITNTIYICI